MPSGRPASVISSASRTGTVGSRSLGLTMNALPQAIAMPNIHIGIIAGKLNGVMPGADAERLAHRVNVDPGARTDRIFALQRLRDAATIFDHLEPALDVALGVGDDLAVLARQQVGELVHVALDQFLILEHHPGPALRVGRGPAGCAALRGVDAFCEVGRGAEADVGLDLPWLGRRRPLAPRPKRSWSRR
jgi:hypothetical protein